MLFSRRVLTGAVLLAGIAAAAGELAGQQRAAVPDSEAQKAARKAAADLYGGRFRAAATDADKSVLAKEILEAALKVEDGSADQYSLLAIAKDVAVGAGNAPRALEAVEKLAERFDVPAAKLKGETLMATARYAFTSTQQKAVAEAAAGIIDQLSVVDDYETALGLCEAAQSAAQKARQHKLVNELTARAQALRKQQMAAKEYLAAMAALEKDAADPAANLAAGRYLCLVKGDWDRGIAMLALGSDTELKTPAANDLKGATSAEDQAALGNAWWDLAATRQDCEKECLMSRAGTWYRKALPGLAGIGRMMAEKRLEEIAKTVHSPTIAAGQSIREWNVAKAELLGTLVGHTARVLTVAFSPDGKLLASGGGDQAVRVWDMRTGRLRGTLTGHTDEVRAVAFSPDGRLLASGGHDNTIKLWEMRTDRLRGTLRGHTHWVVSVAFSPDGKLLVSGAEDKTMRFWDPATGQVGRTINAHQEGRWGVGSVAFSPDGATLASGNGDGTVKLWDVGSGQLRATLEAHTDLVVCVAFSPDGKSLASASGDKTIGVWDVTTGELRATLAGHTAFVRSVRFALDGKVLASGSEDKTIALWDAAAGRLQRTLADHADTVQCVAFSPDGRLLVSASADKTIKLWGRRSGGKP